MSSQKLSFNVGPDDLFVSFERGLQSTKCEAWLVPKALNSVCVFMCACTVCTRPVNM